MSSGYQRIKWRRNIAENFSRLSRVHERYRRQTTDDRQTDGRRHIANMNMSSRSLKTQHRISAVIINEVGLFLKNETTLYVSSKQDKNLCIHCYCFEAVSLEFSNIYTFIYVTFLCK